MGHKLRNGRTIVANPPGFKAFPYYALEEPTLRAVLARRSWLPRFKRVRRLVIIGWNAGGLGPSSAFVHELNDRAWCCDNRKSGDGRATARTPVGRLAVSGGAREVPGSARPCHDPLGRCPCRIGSCVCTRHAIHRSGVIWYFVPDNPGAHARLVARWQVGSPAFGGGAREQMAGGSSGENPQIPAAPPARAPVEGGRRRWARSGSRPRMRYGTRP
jgi:hypothetical protein